MTAVNGDDVPVPAYQAFTAAERPDLWEKAGSLSEVWPKYNGHGKHAGKYFGALLARYAHLQVLFYDPGTESVVARGRSIPFPWDGTLRDLPRGIDAVGLRALEERGTQTALSALAVEVSDDLQGSGLSKLVLHALVDAARSAGLGAFVAPVRPSWKDRYPLIPIDQYAYWCRDDGMPFDPWMRVHARLGATILRAEPHSLEIEAPVADWEAWTGLAMPADGAYVFPFGLAPLHVDSGIGLYWEPNVWMRHEV